MEVPLDTVMAYWFRAKGFSARSGPSSLAWLQVRDTDERSEWVNLFLGVVIQQVMQARDACWAVAATVCGGSDPPPLVARELPEKCPPLCRGDKEDPDSHQDTGRKTASRVQGLKLFWEGEGSA